jgi:hypothetical protein
MKERKILKSWRRAGRNPSDAVQDGCRSDVQPEDFAEHVKKTGGRRARNNS